MVQIFLILLCPRMVGQIITTGCTGIIVSITSDGFEFMHSSWIGRCRLIKASFDSFRTTHFFEGILPPNIPLPICVGVNIDACDDSDVGRWGMRTIRWTTFWTLVCRGMILLTRKRSIRQYIDERMWKIVFIYIGRNNTWQVDIKMSCYNYRKIGVKGLTMFANVESAVYIGWIIEVYVLL